MPDLDSIRAVYPEPAAPVGATRAQQIIALHGFALTLEALTQRF